MNSKKQGRTNNENIEYKANVTVSQSTGPRKTIGPTSIDDSGKSRNKWKISNFFKRNKKKVEINSSDSSSDIEDKASVLRRKYGSASSMTNSSCEGGGGSLSRKDRRQMLKTKIEASRRQKHCSSSDDENASSSLSRFKSDESLSYRKTRSARTERYLKRISKDERENSPFIRPMSHTPSPIISPKLPRRDPRSASFVHLAPNTNGLPSPFYQRTPPPPPPRKYLRSKSEQSINDEFNQYITEKTPRSRKPINVIPVHEPSPEITMPPMPLWLNEPINNKNNLWSSQMKRASSVETPGIYQVSLPVKRATSVDIQIRTPPVPPTRWFARPNEDKHSKRNLEDALNELEEIYQSLKLSDEDLLDRAERRDLPTFHQRFDNSSNDTDDISISQIPHQRAPPNRRSGVPDLVTDDMAYRRFHPNNNNQSSSQNRTSGSYLLISPTLSPPLPPSSTCSEEPNLTYDDMSYRQIRTANSIKIIESQPPFGIPLLPAPAAPNSDYLHAKPQEKFRPSLRPRKTPDVVKDDLAFRNLRKDTTDKRKRAVRSLSANLINIMESQNMEKTQSLSHINRPPPSWIERANLIDTSTETLTQSRANLRSLRNSFFNYDSRPTSIYTDANSRPASTSNYFDSKNLDELLTQLAKEAHDTSEKLGQELEKLEGSDACSNVLCDANNNSDNVILQQQNTVLVLKCDRSKIVTDEILPPLEDPDESSCSSINNNNNNSDGDSNNDNDTTADSDITCMRNNEIFVENSAYIPVYKVESEHDTNNSTLDDIIPTTTNDECAAAVDVNISKAAITVVERPVVDLKETDDKFDQLYDEIKERDNVELEFNNIANECCNRQGEILAADLSLSNFQAKLYASANNNTSMLLHANNFTAEDIDLLAFIGALVALVSFLTAISV